MNIRYKIKRKKNLSNFKIIEINMDKIKKDWYILSNKEKDAYKYLYMLDLNKEELEEYCGDDELMKKYEEKISKLNEDEKFTYFLTDEEDGENIYNSRLKLAEEKGLEKGIKSSSIKIAKSLLDSGMELEEVSKHTNLSLKDILQLKKTSI